jgi:hypothetical protein
VARRVRREVRCLRREAIHRLRVVEVTRLRPVLMAAGMAITAAIAATALRHLEGHMEEDAAILEEDAAIRLLRRIARDLLGATGALVVLTAAAAIAAAGDMEAIAERELIVLWRTPPAVRAAFSFWRHSQLCFYRLMCILRVSA